jgi:uncharacterized protein YhhL (DUF1145 family)
VDKKIKHEDTKQRLVWVADFAMGIIWMFLLIGLVVPGTKALHYQEPLRVFVTSC